MKLKKIKEAERDESKRGVHVEIELRYRVNNRSLVEKRLAELQAKVIYRTHVIDHWFIPSEIDNYEQEVEWFDVNRGCGLRIREQDNDYSGAVVTSLETKKLNRDMDHNTFLETELNIDSYEKGKLLVEMLGRKEFLTIDKNRVVYETGKYKVSIDDIKGFGVGIEIEAVSSSDREETLMEIQEFAKKLGLSETDRCEKSLTVDAMQKLAKF